MIPARHDFKDYAGDTFVRTFRFKNKTTGAALDKTGAIPAMHVRDEPGGTLVADWTSDVSTAGEATGEYVVSATMPAAGEYVVDFQLTESGVVKTYISGALVVLSEVTT